jgi:hypothetical protein
MLLKDSKFTVHDRRGDEDTSMLDRIDLSSPASPSATVSVPLPIPPLAGTTLALAFVGELLVTSEDTGSLQTFDMQEPSDAALLGQLASTSTFESLMTDGDELWVVEGETTTRIDLSDPANPARGDQLPPGSRLLGLRGQHAFVHREGLVDVYDVAETPTLVASLSAASGYIPEYPDSFVILGERLFLTQPASELLWVYDISNPADPVMLAELASAEVFALGTAVGEVLVTPTGEVVSLSDAGVPVLHASLDIDMETESWFAAGSSLYVFSETESPSTTTVRIFDLTDPEAPARSEPIAPISTSGERAFAVRDGILAVASEARTFDLIGLDCPAP